MATATKATRGNVGTNNWTLPLNALTDDGVLYATCAPAKNASVIGDWDFEAFTDGEIPPGSTINSVTMRAQYKVSTTASIASLGVQNGNNGAFDAEETHATEPLTDTNFDTVYNSAPSITDLKTAGRLVARIRGIRGNDNDAVTFSLDYIELRVDYTNNSVTGTSAITLNAITSSSSGNAGASGTSAITLSSIVVSSSGLEEFLATAAIVLSAITHSSVGVETFSGTSAIALPSLLVVAVGEEVFTGSMAAVLASIQMVAEGTHTVGGAPVVVQHFRWCGIGMLS